jgi:hypothetical protein
MDRLRTSAFETARDHFLAEVHAREFTEFFERAIAGTAHARHGSVKGSASNPSQPDNDTAQDEAPLILIKGRWEWRSGADQALNAVGDAARRLNLGCEPKALRVVLCGHGAQEDELRYLAHVLGSMSPMDLTFVRSQQDQSASVGERQPIVQIRLPDDVNGSFELRSAAGMNARVGFGESQELTRSILQVLRATLVSVC